MLLSKLIQQAALESPYQSELTEEYVNELIRDFSSSNYKCLFSSDNGFIAGLLSDGHILLPQTTVAIEIAWYVLPEARGKLEGGRLYEKFENWAKLNKAKAIFIGKPIKDSILVQPGYMKWVSNS